MAKVVQSLLVLACAVFSVAALKVLAPQAYRGHIKHTIGSFGNPNYGGSIIGQLLYFKSEHLGCRPLDRSLISNMGMEGRTIVVMLDRGNCTFVQKVRDAENIAANAVIIVNTDDTLVTMADDGSGRNIGIPSVLISKSEGDRLEAAVSDGTKIMVELSWNMPHPDNHVEWEFWTSSGDINSATFLEEFREPSLALGNSVTFQPNYGIIDGAWYTCDKPGLSCKRQCSNSGRYCAEDPDHDLKHGVDGIDVVQENLRQICIYQHANSTSNPQLWWDYVAQFAATCTGKGTLTEACSSAVMLKVGVDAVAVGSCVTSSGGSDYEGSVNKLLEAQIARSHKYGVAITPAIRINDKNYHGSFACPAPVHLGTCPVLSAICSGFSTAPGPCKTDYCWGKVDACGMCDGDGSSCAGCDGVPNSKKAKDACGVCGGTGSFDKCGKCLPAEDVFRDKSCMGCDGVANSGKVRDACGVCDGDGSTDLCGNCFQADSPQRNKACADTITVMLELTGMTLPKILANEQAIEKAVAHLLTPNVTTPEHVKVVTIVAGNSTSANNTKTGVTVKFEITAQPGTGHATSATFQRQVAGGWFDKQMKHSKLNLKAIRHNHLVAPVVREGTPASGRVEFIPAGGDSKGSDGGLAAAQIGGIAVAGVCTLGMFGVGVRHWVMKREARVRMDMRNLIHDMGKPMEEVSNPTQAGANVDFSSL